MKCVYCHAIHVEVNCPDCRATYHRECASLLKVCATLGCANRLDMSHRVRRPKLPVVVDYGRIERGILDRIDDVIKNPTLENIYGVL